MGIVPSLMPWSIFEVASSISVEDLIPVGAGASANHMHKD